MLLSTSPLSAATLLQNGSVLIFNGNAQVGATFLNWLCNQPGAPTASCGSTSGNIAVASSTGTFTAFNGDFGYIKDLTEAGQPIQNAPFATLANFITFVNALNAPLSNITLDLYEIPVGTDTPSSDCVGVNHCTPTSPAFVNANNPGGLSAFNLDYNSIANSTTASFSFFGTVHDNVPGDSPNTANYVGTFSEPISNITPAQLFATIKQGGSVTAAYGQQGSLTLTLVPEPVTLSLVGAGLLGLGVWGRKRQRD